MISPRNIVLAILLTLLLLYALFEARFLIIGPYITVSSHTDGQVVENGLINLSGRARNAAWISLNGRQIFTDKKGLFSEEILLATGPNALTIMAKDRFGRETKKELEVIVKYKDVSNKEEGGQTATTTSE